jgi:transposase InsO family protein
MRDNGIKIIRTQKYKVTTDSNHAFNIAPNLLDQDFSADGPNQKCPLGIMLCMTLSGNRRAIYPIFGRTKGGFTLLSFLICILGV